MLLKGLLAGPELALFMLPPNSPGCEQPTRSLPGEEQGFAGPWDRFSQQGASAQQGGSTGKPGAIAQDAPGAADGWVGASSGRGAGAQPLGSQVQALGIRAVIPLPRECC